MNRILSSSSALLALALLSGCATIRTTGTGQPDACLVWGIITYASEHDSRQTVDEIRALNAKRDAYCK